MTDVAIGLMGGEGAEKRPGLLARLRQRLADWLVADEPEADPTAGFSTREWADLPVHHPSEEG